MSDRIEREQWLAATPEEVWDAVTDDGWLADRVALDLRPGGDARFESDGLVRTGWVEDVRAPERLIFWWAPGEEPASRVELRIDARG
ncbi:MAG: SRPBCC domain-containing protein, partial [Solirubrobacterales bacterium]|nr:SRPBCC domain-containing protein [Solirubrobacterales bacterium]